jgi:hypothetical protein
MPEGFGSDDKSKDLPAPKVVIALSEKPRLSTEKLLALAKNESNRYRLTPQGKLIYTPDDHEWRSCGREIIPLCRQVLRGILEKAA